MVSDNFVHPALPPLPPRIQRLPVDARGFPVPWFVQWFHQDGTAFESAWMRPSREGDYPDFRVIDSRKFVIAHQFKRCWVCGEPRGKYVAFVIGPMCAINRVSSELPSHRDCAIFSATACPFLTKPRVVRREDNLPEGYSPAAGVGLTRNPGVALVWVTTSYEPFKTEHREIEGGVVMSEPGYLFHIGDAIEVLWFCEGRVATRAEVMASIDSGLPLLRETTKVESDPKAAMAEIDRQYEKALKLVPA